VTLGYVGAPLKKGGKMRQRIVQKENRKKEIEKEIKKAIIISKKY
jgi:hypothetical protein